MRQQFSLTFDLRDATRPDTEREAIGYTRRWAAFAGLDLPSDLEPRITPHPADLDVPGSFPSLTVTFEWDDDSSLEWEDIT
jgi:hypothetical protein